MKDLFENYSALLTYHIENFKVKKKVSHKNCQELIYSHPALWHGWVKNQMDYHNTFFRESFFRFFWEIQKSHWRIKINLLKVLQGFSEQFSEPAQLWAQCDNNHSSPWSEKHQRCAAPEQSPVPQTGHCQGQHPQDCQSPGAGTPAEGWAVQRLNQHNFKSC